jgi:large subunit ribosomal protein L5
MLPLDGIATTINFCTQALDVLNVMEAVICMTQRLRNFYNTSIVPKLMGEFKYKNRLQVTRIEKIVINRGLGDASQNAKVLESSLRELSLIAGQKGVVTRSKKAIAGFKLRQKNPVGVSVTLRGERMYSFLDRLINLALPRIRDFQGVSPRSVDGHGNFSLGLEEQLMFPEIDYDKIDQIRGMDISIVTTSPSDAECLALLKEFGMPFQTV